jgi:hypothetical protein
VTARPRVLLVQRGLAPPGGAAGVSAWMVEALKRDHAVTLLAWHPPDLPRSTASSAPPSAASIVRTLRDPREQDDLRRHLSARAARFSTEVFVREFREVVGAAAGR